METYISGVAHRTARRPARESAREQRISLVPGRSGVSSEGPFSLREFRRLWRAVLPEGAVPKPAKQTSPWVDEPKTQTHKILITNGENATAADVTSGNPNMSERRSASWNQLGVQLSRMCHASQRPSCEHHETTANCQKIKVKR